MVNGNKIWWFLLIFRFTRWTSTGSGSSSPAPTSPSPQYCSAFPAGRSTATETRSSTRWSIKMKIKGRFRLCALGIGVEGLRGRKIRFNCLRKLMEYRICSSWICRKPRIGNWSCTTTPRWPEPREIAQMSTNYPMKNCRGSKNS